MEKINLYGVLKKIYLESDERTTNRIENVMGDFSSFISNFFKIWNLYLEVYEIKEKDNDYEEESFMKFLKETSKIFFNEESKSRLKSLINNYSNIIIMILKSIKDTAEERKKSIEGKKITFNKLITSKTTSEQQYDRFYDELYRSDLVRSSAVKLKKQGKDIFEKINSLMNSESSLDKEYDNVILIINNIIDIIDNNKKIEKDDIKGFLFFINNYTKYEIYSMIDKIESKQLNKLKVESIKLKYIESLLKRLIKSKKVFLKV
jgi:hypothetical protein